MDDYSKREIDIFMREIKESLDTMTKENISSHTKLDENQKLTNGKVAALSQWRERVTGAAWAFGITFTIVIIPLFTWAFITISKIPERINQGIKDSLSNYNIQVHEDN